MSDHILKTIEQAKVELRKHEEAAIATKKLINQLCAFGNLPQEFPDAELQANGASAAVVIRRNTFFGRPLATCVREYLELRKDKPVREATLDEIINGLKEGGFDFKRITENPDDIKRSVAITLAKNPQFHRLPNDDIGPLAWYPNIKKAKENKAQEESEDETVVGTAQAQENKEKRLREEEGQRAAEEMASGGPPPRHPKPQSPSA